MGREIQMLLRVEASQKAASGSQNSKAEVGYSHVLQAEVSWKGTGENQKSASCRRKRGERWHEKSRRKRRMMVHLR